MLHSRFGLILLYSMGVIFPCRLNSASSIAAIFTFFKVSFAIFFCLVLHLFLWPVPLLSFPSPWHFSYLPLLLLFVPSLQPIHFLAGHKFNCLGHWGLCVHEGVCVYVPRLCVKGTGAILLLQYCWRILQGMKQRQAVLYLTVSFSNNPHFTPWLCLFCCSAWIPAFKWEQMHGRACSCSCYTYLHLCAWLPLCVSAADTQARVKSSSDKLIISSQRREMIHWTRGYELVPSGWAEAQELLWA